MLSSYHVWCRGTGRGFGTAPLRKRERCGRCRGQTKMKLKGIIITGLIIVVLETSVFGLWIYSAKPTPDISIALILILPLIFGANIVVGLILYFVKKRQTANIVFANSFVGPVIFYFLWSIWFIDRKDRNYTEYSFEIEKNRFEVSLSKTSDSFSISDITNQKNGSTTGLFFGEYQVNGDTVILTDGQTKMQIINNKLLGFPHSRTQIELTRLTDR